MNKRVLGDLRFLLVFLFPKLLNPHSKLLLLNDYVNEIAQFMKVDG